MAEVFRLKGFEIRHVESEVKVGTDGLILGAVAGLFAEQKRAKRILDIGTGTGIIALMLAQSTEAEITALEVDDRTASEAATNVSGSPFAGQVQVLHEDYLLHRPASPYDLIVSNPPYYTATHETEQARRTLAKHIGDLTPEALFEQVAQDLAPDGYLLLILPTHSICPFEQKGRLHGLQLHGCLYVHTVAGRPAKRAVLYWHRRIPSEGFIRHLTIMEPGGAYTDQYRALMHPYLFI